MNDFTRIDLENEPGTALLLFIILGILLIYIWWKENR